MWKDGNVKCWTQTKDRKEINLDNNATEFTAESLSWNVNDWHVMMWMKEAYLHRPYENVQIGSCEFRCLLSGVAEDSILVYVAATRGKRRKFMASSRNFRT